MRVFVEPTGLHSRGMVRIARALERWAPADVEIVARQDRADLIVVYVIGANQITEARARPQRYAAVQCCLRSAGGDLAEWRRFWAGAVAVWSYYDLRDFGIPETARFLYAPLGIDPVFHEKPADGIDRRLVVTTGYVAGAPAEPIEEVWAAAERAGLEAVHVGPREVHGMRRRFRGWRALEGVSDQVLAGFYRRAAWVAGLRYVEGFELPAVEGLACGARPVMFDQPSMRHWYGDLAEYVAEETGEQLEEALYALFSEPVRPVTDQERQRALAKFNWRSIAEDFWEMVLAAWAEEAAA